MTVPSRRLILRAAQRLALVLSPDALVALEHYLETNPHEDFDQALQRIRQAASYDTNTTISAYIVQLILQPQQEASSYRKEISTKTVKRSNDVATTQIVTAFCTPRLCYETTRKQFSVQGVPSNDENSEHPLAPSFSSWDLLGSAEDKVRACCKRACNSILDSLIYSSAGSHDGTALCLAASTHFAS
jgi:hypothetical protein